MGILGATNENLSRNRDFIWLWMVRLDLFIFLKVCYDVWVGKGWDFDWEI